LIRLFNKQKLTHTVGYTHFSCLSKTPSLDIPINLEIDKMILIRLCEAMV